MNTPYMHYWLQRWHLVHVNLWIPVLPSELNGGHVLTSPFSCYNVALQTLAVMLQAYFKDELESRFKLFHFEEFTAPGQTWKLHLSYIKSIFHLLIISSACKKILEKITDKRDALKYFQLVHYRFYR